MRYSIQVTPLDSRPTRKPHCRWGQMRLTSETEVCVIILKIFLEIVLRFFLIEAESFLLVHGVVGYVHKKGKSVLCLRSELSNKRSDFWGPEITCIGCYGDGVGINNCTLVITHTRFCLLWICHHCCVSRCGWNKNPMKSNMSGQNIQISL